MAQPSKPAKIMSSRLSTMKFMQRATAGTSSSPSTPSEPASKKQRLSNGSYQSTPSSTPQSDSPAVRKTPILEDSNQNGVSEQESARRGDSKWYLSFKEPQIQPGKSPLRIVSAGYSTLDRTAPSTVSEDEETTIASQLTGRRSFGKFNRKVEKQQDPNLSQSDSSSGSESSEQGDEDADDGDKLIAGKSKISQSNRARIELKQKRRAEKEEINRMAEDRRKWKVKLNTLSSLSGRGGISSGGGNGTTSTRSPSAKDTTCFQCGQQGHLKRDCPYASQQSSRNR